MLPETGFYNWFFGVAGLILLSGCSVKQSSETLTGTGSSAWHYHKELSVSSFPEKLSELTDGKVTIKALCYFNPELVDGYRNRQQMILLPFLAPMPDGSFGPDFNGSLSAYEFLESYLNLVSTVESVQLYQRWVSSVEQACPSNLRRNISQCSLENMYSFSKLWGGEKPELYNFERLNLWLEQKNDIRYILLPTLEALLSEAVHGLRYSTNSAPIVKKSAVERMASSGDFLGRASLNWIPLISKRHVADELVSAGSCSVVWEELETLKKSGSKIDYQKLVAVDNAMRAVLLSFINDAFQSLNLKQE